MGAISDRLEEVLYPIRPLCLWVVEREEQAGRFPRVIMDGLEEEGTIRGTKRALNPSARLVFDLIRR